MTKHCETCKYAEWETVDTDRGSYESICGCLNEEIPDNNWNDEWGDTEDCPYWEEEEEYCPSATMGDYSPSCPWNAHGMSIRDFI